MKKEASRRDDGPYRRLLAQCETRLAEGTLDRASGGVGLGLAITRQAMLAHGGAATAENHPAGGLVVRLELPAA